MTFDELIGQVGQRLGYANASSIPATVKVRLLAFMDNRHRQVVTKVPKLRDITNAPLFTTVSGQQAYSLPPSVKAVKSLFDITNQRILYPVDSGLIRQLNPGGANNNFGLPGRFADIGYVPYQLKPPSANALYVVSSTTDTVNVSVEYLRTGGYPSSATVTLTGATPVQVGTNADITDITKFFLAGAPAGFVTLRFANGAGTVLSTLAPRQTFARFRGILMDPAPNANLLYTADYTREITSATTDTNDEPLIDTDWQWILVSGVLMDEFNKMSDPRYSDAKTEWEQGMKDLTSDMMNIDNWVVVPNRGLLPAPYPFKIPVT